MYPTGNRTWGEPGTGGFPGRAHSPFNACRRRPAERRESMMLQGITLERLQDRDALRSSFDHFRRDADATGDDGRHRHLHPPGDGHSHRLEAGRRPRSVEGRSRGSSPATARATPASSATVAADGRELLRRPPTGRGRCRFVSLNYSRWDWHGGDGMNFPKSREEFPLLDQGSGGAGHRPARARASTTTSRSSCGASSAARRGSTATTAATTGRRPNCALLAGGGMKTGQVIGATDRLRRVPGRPPGEVPGSLRHALPQPGHRPAPRP